MTYGRKAPSCDSLSLFYFENQVKTSGKLWKALGLIFIICPFFLLNVDDNRWQPEGRGSIISHRQHTHKCINVSFTRKSRAVFVWSFQCIFPSPFNTRHVIFVNNVRGYLNLSQMMCGDEHTSDISEASGRPPLKRSSDATSFSLHAGLPAPKKKMKTAAKYVRKQPSHFVPYKESILICTSSWIQIKLADQCLASGCTCKFYFLLKTAEASDKICDLFLLTSVISKR